MGWVYFVGKESENPILKESAWSCLRLAVKHLRLTIDLSWECYMRTMMEVTQYSCGKLFLQVPITL